MNPLSFAEYLIVLAYVVFSCFTVVVAFTSGKEKKEVKDLGFVAKTLYFHGVAWMLIGPLVFATILGKYILAN